LFTNCIRFKAFLASSIQTAVISCDKNLSSIISFGFEFACDLDNKFETNLLKIKIKINQQKIILFLFYPNA
jgi:hypothetical protein